MRSYILKLHGLCMHSFYSILLVNQDASTILSMCIRAAHIKDVPWIYLSANDGVQFSHATIWRQPEPDPSCGVDYDGKEKRVSEIIKGKVARKSIILVEVFISVVLAKRRQAARTGPAPHGGKKCVARGLKELRN